MHIHSLTKHLPEEIVRHILSFDDRIVLRKRILHIIHKINKDLYKNSYDILLKKPTIKEGRTTVYNNDKHTWCTMRLWNNKRPNLDPYISYSSKKNEFKFKFNIWTKGDYRECIFYMP